MSLTAPVSLAAATIGAAASGTTVSGSVTPSTDALLIVVYVERGAAIAPTMSTTLANVGAWTVLSVQQSPVGGAGVAIAYAKVTGSAGTGTITATHSSSARRVLEVFEVTGHDTTTPVPQNANNTGTSSTLTVTLGSTPAATSMVFAAVGATSATGAGAGSGFTEIDEQNSGGGSPVTLQAMYDIASADTTADWTGLGAVSNAGIAIEIAEAASVSTFVPQAIFF